MSRYALIPQEKREAILKRIKEGGEPANRVAAELGVSPKTVYNWLAKQSEKSGVSWIEYNRQNRHHRVFGGAPTALIGLQNR